ncbi:YkgJ family cysteine cluster protein [sulfur-oxidizing endosymbiont of Gigantopelta aegis]|uniref:YkgJ family cysteine cluster protein n=1 Tax=sulfur-oxidizing endosymbiont of Gigantopelta aegis TaxID=2794934 RepID=UPI0018DD4D24|nr:YkgJ family cysteine cluster protein [sulfur-oxidizing endosymbiont of Gigantopelta aegis]
MSNEAENKQQKQTNAAYPAPQRVKFSSHEQRLPWLSTLMDAYLITDQGISEAIKREEKQGKKLACARGCATCCQSHETIPVYPLELMGMSWYATEVLAGELREALKTQLRNLETLKSCPFLIDSACSIHAVRPMACRSFNVFNKQCEAGEDAYYTRRDDVLTPIKKYSDDAFDIMLPFYGVKNKTERRKMIKAGGQHQMAKVMRELNWSTLADKMDIFEKNK